MAELASMTLLRLQPRVPMEMTTGYTIYLEVPNNGEVALKSVNMEKTASKNILQLIIIINIVDVVTDASASIKELMAECVISSLIGAEAFLFLSITTVVSFIPFLYPGSLFQDILHSPDIGDKEVYQ